MPSKKIKNVYFLEKLPSLNSICGSAFVICDQKLKSQIQNWCKGQKVYFVQAGERLKDLNQFALHTKNILKSISKAPQAPSAFIGVGGGSVTDFTGFFSSIYKRGKPVYYIPTTLLSAVDASHGGKTALNVSSVKNVLGTYHFPQKVFIIKHLFQGIKSSEVFSAYGELIKIALIHNISLYESLKQQSKPSFDHFWKVMPSAIKSKLELVEKDPFEKKSVRRFLNLGHTLGHCFESYHKIPHGRAVAMGTLFALHWSADKKFISSSLYSETQNLIKHYIKVSSILKIPLVRLKKLLRQDKKSISSGKIEFVFIKGIGKPFIKTVSIDDIVQFYKKYYL
ncbi:MAG: 3-dehydroquinate synthase [Bdellovibrionales bacterium]|nr:3-dehydroquinate synthase [Bdellovibrionales bacterium]